MFDILTSVQADALQERLGMLQVSTENEHAESIVAAKISETLADLGLSSSHLLIQSKDYDLLRRDPNHFAVDSLWWVQVQQRVITSQCVEAVLAPLGYDVQYDKEMQKLTFAHAFTGELWRKDDRIALSLPKNVVVKTCTRDDVASPFELQCELDLLKNPQVEYRSFMIQCVNARIFDSWSLEQRHEYEKNEKQLLGSFLMRTLLFGTDLEWNKDLNLSLPKVIGNRTELCDLWLMAV